MPSNPLDFSGKTVLVERTFVSTGGGNVGSLVIATIGATFEGSTITSTAPEIRGGGRTCTIFLTR